MARPRTIPDATIFAAILHLIDQGGDRAVSFSAVARVTGLAAPSLVQRYGSLSGMIQQAFEAEWDRLGQSFQAALAEVKAADKGAQALLKALAPGPGAALLAASARDAGLAKRAADWRAGVEQALAEITGDGERAAMLLSLWSGQSLWDGLSPRGFRMKDAIRRLG